MTKASDNPFPSILVEEGAEPAAPAAGHQRLYLSSSTHKLMRTDSSGTEVEIGAAGDITTDAAWAAKGDLIVGTANNTAAVLTAGSNGKVLMAASGEATGLKWETPASGGSGRPYFDTLTLHATYGDDFTGASLDAKWSLDTYTGANLRFQCDDGTTLEVANPTNGHGQIYQTAPAGDFSIILSLFDTLHNDNFMDGPCILDSSGNGVGLCTYQSALWLNNITAFDYASNATNHSLANFIPGRAQGEMLPYWLKLTKVGQVYTGFFSRNGRIWVPTNTDHVTPTTKTWTGTVAYIGFGMMYSNSGANRFYVDRFNVV
jgi:hypothetical protein